MYKRIDVFIIGSKGIPAQYGGFETFVENLTKGRKDKCIHYHVSCMGDEEKKYFHNGAECFTVKVPLSGAKGRIMHVSLALSYVEKWCDRNPNNNVIVYVLGCRIGPLMKFHSKRLHQYGAIVLCNPDGLEWKRDKWNRAEKKFLKLCEASLVKNADLAVCDSVSIEDYIKKEYRTKAKNTTYIAYGSEVTPSSCSDDEFMAWAKQYGITKNQYYLIVGRFVPENNYETMIREFMMTNSNKDLVIITNVEKNDFYNSLMKNTQFDKDKRVKFVGTVYDRELLSKIRENAYGYFHGHEVGGTNPSLLEAMASTDLNLLYDIGFNREVGGDTTLYWKKEKHSLSRLIQYCDNELDEKQRFVLGDKAKQRIKEYYSWEYICKQYESLFENVTFSLNE